MSVIVEEIAAKFGIEVDEAAFGKLESALHGLHHGVLGLGAVFAAAVGAVTAIVESTAAVGNEASVAADKIGISTQALQGLQSAAKISNVSSESLASGLKFLGKNAAEAANGSAEMSAEFARAGVSIFDAHGKIKPTDELMRSLSEKFHTMPGGAQKIALAMKLMGRGGVDMVPMLNKGTEAIDEMIKSAEEAGVIMSDEVIEASKEWTVATKETEESLEGLKYAIGGPLIKQFTEYVKVIGKWIRTNREAIATPIVKFFKVLGDAIHWVTGETAGAQFVVGSLKVGFMALASVVAAYATVSIGAAVATAAAWLYAAAPVIALGAAIGLIADDLYVFSQGGDSVLGRLIKWFNTIDPNDNPMLNALKAIGALIFDFTSGKSWDNFTAAAIASFDEVMKYFNSKLGLEYVTQAQKLAALKLGRDQAASFGVDVNKMTGGQADVRESLLSGRVIEAYSRMQTAAQSSAQGDISSSSVPSNAPKSISISAPVTIHANTNATAGEISSAVTEHIEGVIQKHNAAAYASLKGG